MNNQHDISEEEASEISLWNRLWPILVGVLIALALAGGGYWLGAHTPDREQNARETHLEASAVSSDAMASSAIAEASGVILQGTFTPVAALHAIFGETIKKGSASFARWTEVDLPQTQTFQPYLGAGPMLVGPLGAFPIREGGENRQLLLFQSVPESRPPGSQPEGAVIGAAVFRQVGNGWQLVRETRAITAAGAYGRAPAGRPVALGPTHLGLLFEGAYDNQGETIKYAFLVEQNEQGFVLASPIFDMGRDNSSSCSSSSSPQSCYSYTGQLRFSPTASNGFYLLDLVLKGTRPNSEGGLDSLIDVRQYRYLSGQYEEDARKHVLKLRPLQTQEPVTTPVEPAASPAQ